MSKTSVRRSNPEKERRWQEVVRGQPRSGQSVREYCRDVGVKESAFYWWRKELARRSETRKAARSRTEGGRKVARSTAANGRRRSRGAAPRGKPHQGKPATAMPLGGTSSGNDASPFVPIHLLAGDVLAEGVASAAAVEIHLGDGRMVRVGAGVDRQTLVDVLCALEVRSC